MVGAREQNIDIEEYYIRYGPMVLRRCRQLLGNEDKAQDAMQEVFARLVRKKDRIKGTYPSSLLYRIATNICLNTIRDQHGHLWKDAEDTLSNIAVHDDTEKHFIIRDLLDRLFQKEKVSTRDIAVLHYVDGMTLQEVAGEVGLSVSGVRKRLRELRARVNVKKEIYHE